MDWVIGITWLLCILLCLIFWPRESDEISLDELIKLEDELQRVQNLIAADPDNVLREKRPEMYLKSKLLKKRNRFGGANYLEGDHELDAMIKKRREELDEEKN